MERQRTMGNAEADASGAEVLLRSVDVQIKCIMETPACKTTRKVSAPETSVANKFLVGLTPVARRRIQMRRKSKCIVQSLT